MEDNYQFKIEVDSIAFSLCKKLPNTLFLSNKCCIFKIPNILYHHNQKAFVPIAFSIGPWHHDREHLKLAEEIKLNYLRRFLSRWPSPETKLKELIQAISEIGEDVHAHYAGPIEMSVDDFVKLLVIDGCFIIELFRKNNERPSLDEYDSIFHLTRMLQYLLHDLILLENQIPWLVLQRLFNMIVEPGSSSMDPRSSSLEHLGIKFFESMYSTTGLPLLDSYQGQKHILELLRESLISLSDKDDTKESNPKLLWQQIPSAQSLKEAGIKFKKSEFKSILDVKFVDGVLEVPSLLIHETTEVVFRNLISFEQCCTKCPAKFTSHSVLFNDLINTKKDLKILSEEGIIENWLNPEVAT